MWLMQVCVVGAGPAGVHMALELKNHGYENVQIFEKSGRVGGKSYDIQYRGVKYSLGTTFLEPDYFESVIPLAKKYNAGDLHSIPSIKVYPNNNSTGGANFSSNFIFSELRKDFPKNCPDTHSNEDCIIFMAETILLYIK